MELAVDIEYLCEDLGVDFEGMREKNYSVKVVFAKPVDLTPSA